jgi:hypothetical protein
MQNNKSQVLGDWKTSKAFFYIKNQVVKYKLP